MYYVKIGHHKKGWVYSKFIWTTRTNNEVAHKFA